MHAHARYALQHPVYDPIAEMPGGGFHFVVEHRVTAGLTVNIGLE